METSKKATNHDGSASKKLIEEKLISIERKLEKQRNNVFKKFPIVFVFLSTFGLVCTLYGFEKIIDNVAFFEEEPMYLLATGVFTLLLTGALYKKL